MKISNNHANGVIFYTPMSTQTFRALEVIKKRAIIILSELRREIAMMGGAVTTLNMLPVYKFLSHWRDRLGDDSSFLDAILKDVPQLDLSKVRTFQKADKAASVLRGPVGDSYHDLKVILQFFRKKKEYLIEYQLRNLYVKLVLMDIAPGNEALARAIQLEQEHLETVVYAPQFPGTSQEKYNQHLENTFELLFKFMGVPFDIKASFNQKYKQTLNIKNVPGFTVEKRIQFQRSLAFLCTRPEWPLFCKRGYAKNLLNEVIQSTQKNSLEIQLDLLNLETNRLVTQNTPSKEALNHCLKHIDDVAQTLPLSCTVVPWLLKAKVREKMMSCGYESKVIVEQIKQDLHKVITVGESQHKALDFRSLHALAECHFLHGLYCTLCYETLKERKQGIKSLEKASQSVWSIYHHKLGADRLLAAIKTITEPAPQILLNKRKMKLVEQVKYILQDKVCDLLSTLSDTSPSDSHEKIDNYPEKSVALFLSNKVKEAESLMRFYSDDQHEKAFKLDSLIAKRHAYFLDSQNELVFNLVQLQQIVNSYFDAAKDCPLSGFIIASKEQRCLDNACYESLQFDITANSHKTAVTVSPIISFNDKFDVVLQTIDRLQGNLSYVDLNQAILKRYVCGIINSPLLYQIYEPHIKRQFDKKRIDGLRHNFFELRCVANLITKAYTLSDILNSPSDEDAMAAYTLDTYELVLYVAKSAEFKKQWFQVNQNILVHKMRIIDRQDQNAISKAHLFKWKYYLFYLLYNSNSEEIEPVKNGFFSQLPDTYDGFLNYIKNAIPSNDESKIPMDYLILMRMKGLYLIENLQVTKGKELFAKAHQLIFKNVPIAVHEDWQVNFILHHQCFDLNKMNYDNKHPIRIQQVNLVKEEQIPACSHQTEETPKKVVQSRPIVSRVVEEAEEAYEIPFSLPVDETAMIKKQALEKIRNEEIKKEKKNERAKSSLPPSSAISDDDTTAAPPTTANKEVSKDVYELLSLLLTMTQSSPMEGPWEDRSYWNDIKMTRHQLLQLIIGLGGSFSAKGGNGSHSVAHLPSIEFNGKDLGSIVDYNAGKLITLTNGDHNELDYYQIKHARKIILSQGYNLDSVTIKK